jgi:hypothetical protein
VTRYVALVEFQDGEYWISFPGIDKTYRLAKAPGDIIAQARAFLDEQAKPVMLPPALGGTLVDPELPPSLDDALTDPVTSFEGARLLVVDWEPPAG